MSRFYTESHGIIDNLRGKKLRVVDGKMEIRLKGGIWVQTFPSTTTIIGLLKQDWAMPWVAKSYREYMEDAIVGLEKADQSVIPFGVLRQLLDAGKREYREISKKALNVGGDVHNSVEVFLKTGKEPTEPSEEALSAFLAFLEWKDEHNLEVIDTEQRLVGDRWQGTCDLVCNLDGKKFVVDFKTSKQPRGNKPYSEWIYQLACYRSAIPECEGMGVLRLDKLTGYPDYYDLSDQYEWGLRVFERLTDLYYEIRGE